MPFHDILTVQSCGCVAQFLRMDPNLLRECAQRLIETADFIRGSGVNGGSVSSSSAPSNTSNTRPRTDDNISISSGSSGSHRAVPNTAPSVSESAWQEHNRIFGYRPPGSSRQGRNFPRNSRQSGRNGKAHGRAAANASWSRSFICLANAGQGCPPSTSERIELTLNGLGEKKIIFPKDGDAGDVHEKILECFPALRAGYELLRLGDGRSKDLLLIPMPQNGYTVPYLKSVLGQAKGYLRPLQEDIPLLGKPDADFSDKVRSSNLSAGYGGNVVDNIYVRVKSFC